jgi:hypothetical protein
MAEWIYFLHASREDFARPELRPYRVGFLRGHA